MPQLKPIDDILTRAELALQIQSPYVLFAVSKDATTHLNHSIDRRRLVRARIQTQVYSYSMLVWPEVVPHYNTVVRRYSSMVPSTWIFEFAEDDTELLMLVELVTYIRGFIRKKELEGRHWIDPISWAVEIDPKTYKQRLIS